MFLSVEEMGHEEKKAGKASAQKRGAAFGTGNGQACKPNIRFGLPPQGGADQQGEGRGPIRKGRSGKPQQIGAGKGLSTTKKQTGRESANETCVANGEGNKAPCDQSSRTKKRGAGKDRI